MKKISQICKAYWRPIVVIVSLSALCLMFSCCKKKDPIPDPTPTCQTGIVLFAGVYQNSSSSSKAGFTIELLHNNCPTENSNTYVIKGFGEAVKSYSAVNQPLFTQSTYTLYSTETASLATNTDEKISLTISYNLLSVSSSRLKSTIKFIK